MPRKFRVAARNPVGPGKESTHIKHMKRIVVFSLLTLSLALVVGTTGCKKSPTGVKVIPDSGRGDRSMTTGGGRSDAGNAGVFDTTGTSGQDVSATGAPVSGKLMNSGPQDRSVLGGHMINFDVDSATIKKTEKSKLDKVAAYMKSNPTHDLLIEGHCDERGTEGYNLSLGEKRAMSAREYLINAGVKADNIYTISYGETRPIEPLNSDAAFSKNRRDEFVVALPAN